MFPDMVAIELLIIPYLSIIAIFDMGIFLSQSASG